MTPPSREELPSETLFIERSKVRGIIIGSRTLNCVESESLLRQIDALPIFPEDMGGVAQLPPSNYSGEIKVGDLFLWEANLPHAREEVIVVRIDTPTKDERKIWCRNSLRPMHMYLNKTVWNDESRFREAVTPSQMKHAIAPLKDWETEHPHGVLSAQSSTHRGDEK
jgi:hypothetical protein